MWKRPHIQFPEEFTIDISTSSILFDDHDHDDTNDQTSFSSDRPSNNTYRSHRRRRRRFVQLAKDKTYPIASSQIYVLDENEQPTEFHIDSRFEEVFIFF